MQRIIAFIIIFLGLAGFWYYEANYDFASICDSYNQETLSKKLKQDTRKSADYANKWRISCNAYLNKNDLKNNTIENDLFCKKIDKAAISTLAYVSVVKKQDGGDKKAQDALNDTIKNISQHSECVQFEIFNGMLNRSLKNIK